jgi:hypothetical protein
MRDTQALYSSSSRVRGAHCSLRFAIFALLLCSSQSPLFAADASSLLEEIEASKGARLASEAALHELRDCVRNSGANQQLESAPNNWSFDFSNLKIKLPFGVTTSLPCPDVGCRVAVAEEQLNSFAAAQINQHNLLLRQVAKLHERLNNVASCIK